MAAGHPSMFAYAISRRLRSKSPPSSPHLALTFRVHLPFTHRFLVRVPPEATSVCSKRRGEDLALYLAGELILYRLCESPKIASRPYTHTIPILSFNLCNF
ncbi:uncharacterized protein DS421_16g560470 [Arachis hypogaea]|nr:uncharacterized protein DS421_16g560470 [Arachis hypogaea]